MSCCINRRKPVPQRTDRGGTLRYAWLRAPPIRQISKSQPRPRSQPLTQKPSYEGGAKAPLRRAHHLSSSAFPDGGHAVVLPTLPTDLCDLVCDCPAGKSLRIFRNDVKPLNQKYSAFVLTQISRITPLVSRQMRGVGHRHERAVRCDGRRWRDRRCAPDAYGEVVWFGRRGAGVKLRETMRNDGGKRAVLREEHEVSRKAIAQGRPECFR